MKRSDINLARATPHHDVAAALQRTNRHQSDAADPRASVWVNANAGTGKTHVLTQRVLRLLLSGTQPQRILCLTYTKAAAAEMSTRVFDRLAEWVTAAADKLAKDLQALTGMAADEEQIQFARTLFTRAIETPGGLKVQTIHAFAERLLQRFPLEAGLPPGFAILDDNKARELSERAIAATLEDATAAPESVLGEALTLAVRFAADTQFDDLLAKMMAERAWLTTASRLDLGASGDDFQASISYLGRVFGTTNTGRRQDIEARRAHVLSDAAAAALRDHLAGGSDRDLERCEALREALRSADDAARGKALAAFFLKSDGSGPLKSVMTKKLATERPDLNGAALDAQARFWELTRELNALTLIEATGALYRLAGHALQYYTDAKRAAGALDFDDLIERTTSLLSTSTDAQWVLFKLDGGLDHVLVDEAQDTSPEQWSIIKALAEEFFSGQSAREAIRTVFAVGDEKQSIYSFQGAAPERFAEMGAHFKANSHRAGQLWHELPLDLSFRTVEPVLEAVDAVFADAERTPGLSAQASVIRHFAKRAGQSGLVEVWPTERYDDADPVDPWLPLQDASERAPANRLAERIAALIAYWLETKEKLASEDRPIEAGDILVLVRKRNPFAVPMVAALKARGIPVAGSDRIALTEQIAVQDLMVLGDFLTLPEDDLALATVLKGPLFNLDDDHLFSICHGRKGALWKSLLAAAKHDVRFSSAAETLKRWRAKADFAPPFEFFSALLDRDHGRSKLLHRLGPEAADAIDEFLDIALTYDDGAPPSLTGFLAALREGDREVKRDMEHGRNEVRVMTVHGAKGLEAPIVFLPDTCTTASGDAGARVLKMEEARPNPEAAAPVVWQVKGTSKLDAVRDANLHKAARETEERNRLFYVALTRARDRLYVSGYEGRKGRADHCWYDLVTEALSDRLHRETGFDGGSVLRLQAPQLADHEKPRTVEQSALAAQQLPAFARTRAAGEAQLSIPLAPSRLEAYAPDEEGEPVAVAQHNPADVPDGPTPATLKTGDRFLRGSLTHALLQHLPAIDPNQRRDAAERFIATKGKALSPAQRKSVVRETLAILGDGEFAALFSDTSRAEVPLAAVIPRPHGKGPALELSGQIDRLAVLGDEVLIVDYKTNRPPPRDVHKVAPAYLFQLAAYVLALRRIYPGKHVRSALLWTDGPHFMAIPDATIDAYINRLWDLDPASLDGS